MKCPLCKKEEHKEIEGTFTTDVSDGWHGKQVEIISLYYCNICGVVFTST